MENNSQEKLELPPGFRFHPTDEELITHYLSQKVVDSCFCALAIGEVDLNKCEPWDLPWRAKMGEKEWYFFCVRDRKYPTGLRTNRATDAGYWKATGKDKEIYKAKTLIGMKKTLVFYRGRAPKGTKTNWVMHEFRLEGKYSAFNLPKSAKNEWVICRVFQKSSGGKKTHISGLLPPLMDSPSDTNHVTCFSTKMEDPKQQQQQQQQQNYFIDSFSSNSFMFSSSSSNSNLLPSATALFSKSPVFSVNNQYPDSVVMQENSILKMLIDNQGQKPKPEFSQENNGQSPDMCNSGVINPELVPRSFDVGGENLDYLWGY